MRAAQLCGVTLLCLLAAATAAEPGAPIVRIQLEPETVRVGEAATLRVTVLGPTWFPKPPVFPSFEVPNAIVRLPPDSSSPTSATVAGERWSGVTRRYQVLPLIGGDFVLGGGRLRVTVANPGAANVQAELAVPEVRLAATVPDGAEGLDPYLAGTSFELLREMAGDPQDLAVGDALVVTYVAEISGLPPAFLPPIAPEVTSTNVSVYADEPRFSEAEGLVSRREERTTVVVNQGGEVVLPGVRLEWWNTSEQRPEMAALAPVTFVVPGGPQIAETAAGESPVDWPRRLLALLMALVILLLLWRYVPRLMAAWRARRERMLRSEAHQFDRLVATLRSDADGSQCYAALLSWQQRLCPQLGLRQFASEYGNPAFVGCIEALSESVHGRSGSAPDVRAIVRPLTEARSRFRRGHRQRDIGLLPPLNPTR